jgi:hypothetical protein
MDGAKCIEGKLIPVPAISRQTRDSGQLKAVVHAWDQNADDMMACNRLATEWGGRVR